MIEVSHLTKRYGSSKAVNDISFFIGEGEIVGFLGPNGAGKSTTMNILTGYLSASEGTAKIAGYDILESPNEAKRKIGYLPELPPLYLDMTVKEYLSFMFDLKKVKLKKKEHIEEICRLVKIQNVYERIIKNLSKGYRQRVGLAQALLGNPQVLILDEPTVGLDPQQIIDIRTLIKKLGKTHTIILSSHVLSEIEAVCERILIINHGQIVADGTPEELSGSMAADRTVTMRIRGSKKDVLALLKDLPGVASVKALESHEEGSYDYALTGREGRDMRIEVFDALAKKGWPILMCKMPEYTLEDIYLKLISQDVPVRLENTASRAKASKAAPDSNGADADETDAGNAADSGTADEHAVDAAQDSADADKEASK